MYLEFTEMLAIAVHENVKPGDNGWFTFAQTTWVEIQHKHKTQFKIWQGERITCNTITK